MKQNENLKKKRGSRNKKKRNEFMKSSKLFLGQRKNERGMKLKLSVYKMRKRKQKLKLNEFKKKSVRKRRQRQYESSKRGS